MSRTVTAPAALPGPAVPGPVVGPVGVPVAAVAMPGVSVNPPVIPSQPAIMPAGANAGAGAMSPSTVPVPSPVAAPIGGGMTSPHPHQPGIGIKPGGGHSPSPNVLQVVKQVHCFLVKKSFYFKLH